MYECAGIFLQANVNQEVTYVGIFTLKNQGKKKLQFLSAIIVINFLTTMRINYVKLLNIKIIKMTNSEKNAKTAEIVKYNEY